MSFLPNKEISGVHVNTMLSSPPSWSEPGEDEHRPEGTGAKEWAELERGGLMLRHTA